MLISTKATDTIYQEVLNLLKQQGVEENESPQQHVLLGEGIFLGYRFQTSSLYIDWLAQNDILVLKTNNGGIVLQKQLSLEKTNATELNSKSEQHPVAA